ncbi:MAG: hypothetical protein ACRCT1_09585 [Microcoleaceae cyanobacterium]|jgi:hypothetical protein
MIQLKERYVVDEQGNRVGVFLDITDYQRLLDELEELEALCAYDRAKAANDQVISFDEAIREIERDRA